MSAAAQIRQFASKYASINPEVSYDLLDLASRVAQEEGQDQGQQGQQAQQKQGGELPPALKEHMEKKEKEKGDEGKDEGQEQQKQAYSRLKNACLAAARENPNARAAFMPILKTIKQLG